VCVRTLLAALALVVRQVYAKHGWAGLKASEAFAETSSLDTAPFARFDAFFEGADPDDRQYLLLEASSGGHFSDEEGADARGEVTEPEDNSGDEEGDSDSQVVKTNIDLLSKTQQANDCYVWRKRFMCPRI